MNRHRDIETADSAYPCITCNKEDNDLTSTRFKLGTFHTKVNLLCGETVTITTGRRALSCLECIYNMTSHITV